MKMTNRPWAPVQLPLFLSPFRFQQAHSLSQCARVFGAIPGIDATIISHLHKRASNHYTLAGCGKLGLIPNTVEILSTPDGRPCERTICSASCQRNVRLRETGGTEMRVLPGHPYPLGAGWDGEGVNFALFSENATGVELCLFESDAGQGVPPNPRRGAHRSGVARYLPEVRPGQIMAIACMDPMNPGRPSF